MQWLYAICYDIFQTHNVLNRLEFRIPRTLPCVFNHTFVYLSMLKGVTRFSIVSVFCVVCVTEVKNLI